MEQSFADYWNALETAFEEIFLMPFSWVEPSPDLVAGAQEDGWTPEQFAAWHLKNEGYSTAEDIHCCGCLVCLCGK